MDTFKARQLTLPNFPPRSVRIGYFTSLLVAHLSQKLHQHQARFMRITFGNRLSAQSWEVALGDFASPSQRIIGSTSSGDTLEFDLSEVGFADFIILGRLLILIDGLVAKGRKVIVKLPTSEPLRREAVYLDPKLSPETSSDASI